MKERKLAILKDADDWLRVYSPYSKNFVEYLKINIASQDRQPLFHEVEGKQRFDCWRVRRTYLQDIYKLMTDFWPNEEIVSDLAEEEGETIGSKLEWLFALCHSEEDTKRLYQTLSFILHPDRGGSDELMKKLNETYTIKVNPKELWE